MDVESRLLSIDAKTLEDPVRRALGRDSAEVVNWSLCSAGRVGNPVSAGVFRFSGVARESGATTPWSVVLKITRSPTNVGIMNMGGGDDPAHWNYWKREMHVYRSGLLASLPKGLAAPRWLGTTEFPEDVCWLWLEDIRDVDEAPWTLRRYAVAANHLRRFNGSYLSCQPMRSVPWLSTGPLRQWCIALAQDKFFRDAEQTLDAAQRPGRSHTCSVSDLLLRLLKEPERWLAVLDRLPRTLCHHDASTKNLMTRRDQDGSEETVTIDWAMAGSGAIGEEPAQLTSDAIDALSEMEPEDIRQVIFENYLQGMRDVGWRGNVEEVRLGHALATSVRLALWTLRSFKRAAARRAFQDQPSLGDFAEEAVEQRARSIRLITALADEVSRLAT